MDCWIEGLNGTTLSGCLFAVQSFLVGSDTLCISQSQFLRNTICSSLDFQVHFAKLPSPVCKVTMHTFAKLSTSYHQVCQLHITNAKVVNSPNPLDCPKCSSKFPGLKFYGLPNTWNVFLFCPQQRRLPNFRNVLKPQYFSSFDGSCKLCKQPFQASTSRDFF
jgi:hypothetical protein